MSTTSPLSPRVTPALNSRIENSHVPPPTHIYLYGGRGHAWNTSGVGVDSTSYRMLVDRFSNLEVKKQLNLKELTVVEGRDFLSLEPFPGTRTIILFPGGHCSQWDADLVPEVVARIRHLVFEGCDYVGICGGAFLACQEVRYGSIHRRRDLAFFDGTGVGPLLGCTIKPQGSPSILPSESQYDHCGPHPLDVVPCYWQKRQSINSPPIIMPEVSSLQPSFTSESAASTSAASLAIANFESAFGEHLSYSDSDDGDGPLRRAKSAADCEESTRAYQHLSVRQEGSVALTTSKVKPATLPDRLNFIPDSSSILPHAFPAMIAGGGYFQGGSRVDVLLRYQQAEPLQDRAAIRVNVGKGTATLCFPHLEWPNHLFSKTYDTMVQKLNEVMIARLEYWDEVMRSSFSQNTVSASLLTPEGHLFDTQKGVMREMRSAHKSWKAEIKRLERAHRLSLQNSPASQEAFLRLFDVNRTTSPQL